jgi:hypothetical protein
MIKMFRYITIKYFKDIWKNIHERIQRQHTFRKGQDNKDIDDGFSSPNIFINVKIARQAL